jgi:4-carboxymuconolactone decarboxylase
MRMNTPRIPALSDDQANAEQKAAIDALKRPGYEVLNVLRTMANIPEALAAFLVWGRYVNNSSLGFRDREIVILRAGWLCKSGYEFDKIKRGPDAGWSPNEQALIRISDDLMADQCVSDSTWKALQGFYSDTQIMDAIFAATLYISGSMMLNSFGVQAEPGVEIDPELRA